MNGRKLCICLTFAFTFVRLTITEKFVFNENIFRSLSSNSISWIKVKAAVDDSYIYLPAKWHYVHSKAICKCAIFSGNRMRIEEVYIGNHGMIWAYPKDKEE